MKQLAIQLFMQVFGRRIASVFAAAIVWLVFAAVGKLASLSPQLAATVDTNQLANWLFCAVMIAVNALSNHFHLQPETAPLLAALEAEEGTLAVPVKRAEPVK